VLAAALVFEKQRAGCHAEARSLELNASMRFGKPNEKDFFKQTFNPKIQKLFCNMHWLKNFMPEFFCDKSKIALKICAG
jgi:hypothetical protein